MIVLPTKLAISTGADRNVSLDFTKDLDAAELFTGTPTVAPIDGGVTIDNERVNDAEAEINGKPVAIGKALQFHLTAGATAGTYGISIGCGTNSNPAETPKYRINVTVL